MYFNPDNRIVQLCAKGMEQEGTGSKEEAQKLFQQAWDEASDDEEKCIAAHYLARHQNNVSDKLRWDITALQFATQAGNKEMIAWYPSLYLNIAKSCEDLNDFDNARENYQSAFSFISFLPYNGYGEIITRGIINGIERVKK